MGIAKVNTMYIKGYDNKGNTLFKSFIKKRSYAKKVTESHIDDLLDVAVIYTNNGDQVSIIYDKNHGGIKE